ncbi:hypothetical protein MED01_002380 [Micromonospora sp. MED01]|uniref:hypothetical protein n=1 Tax=Micromonospora alfalfae TaxID=2911212 RepID=UPI001EE98163|nr:hypothetical protein [Micromonospora alfalfae]MCG5464215.1 hypothetical protein [Micromonospora alfalfae]
MAKISDELDDVQRRIQAAREAQDASNQNVRDALTRLEAKVAELETIINDGEASPEVQAKLDELKSAADDVRTAAESADDGYEPPVVEPAPVPGVEGEPEPGSVADRQRGGF